MSKIKTGRHDTKTDVICRHAARLFREKGFAATSVRELADSLGIEAPSVYNHIGSKNEILSTICFRVAHEFHHQLQEVQAQKLPAYSRLEKVIRFHIRTMISHFDEVFVSNNEWKQLKKNDLEEFLQQRKDYEFQLVQIVKEGIHAKTFRKTNPHIAILTILSALRGVEFIQKYRGQMTNRVLENNIVNLLLKGIIN